MDEMQPLTLHTAQPEVTDFKLNESLYNQIKEYNLQNKLLKESQPPDKDEKVSASQKRKIKLFGSEKQSDKSSTGYRDPHTSENEKIKQHHDYDTMIFSNEIGDKCSEIEKLISKVFLVFKFNEDKDNKFNKAITQELESMK
jgi:hypothetical protein